MSLISQRDRKLAIEALEYYKTAIPLIINFELPSDIVIKQDEQKMMEVNALINWIKLEHYKNEDKSMVLSRNEAVEVDSV
jgi:hypothetical protein